MPQQPTPKPSRSILIVGDPSQRDRDLAAALAQHGAVVNVRSLEEALRECSARDFDLVVGDADALLPFAHRFAPRAAETILEHIDQGVCIVAADGTLIWANAKLTSYPEPVVEQLRAACAQLCREFAADGPAANGPRSRRRNVAVGREYNFEVVASAVPVRDDADVQVVALLFDVTANRRLQAKLDTLDAAGRELVRLDAEALAQTDVGERLHVLEDKIISYMHDLFHFDHFIVRVLDQKTNRLETVIAGGMSEEAKSLDLSASSEGSGISGHVAATGRSYICPDVSNDARYLPGMPNARSTLTVPLQMHDRVIGVLNVESERGAAFTEDDRQFAEIFGRYVAIALNILKLLVVERCATTGQLATDVSGELAAPLNDIVSEATHIMEQYIGHDDLRSRLHSIIDSVDRAKRALKSVTESPGISGLVPESLQSDPVIDGKRILIADDEEIIRETVSDVLSKAGALTVTARDGEEAVAMIHSQHFDLVLSDIKMPLKNGYEVFAAAKEANVHCPVILITGFGYDPDHSIVRASKDGLSGILYKPFKVEKLLDQIRSALTAHVV